jgi:diguanylate cyclase (GGDEF)-like protein
MDVELKREAAFAGQRVKQKVVFALALCSVIPLLVLTYVLHGHLVPGLETAARGMTDVLAIPTLVAFTGLLMAGGGYVVWDLASAVSRAASLVSTAQPVGQTAGARGDEIGTLMTSFNRMMTTIEQQADEINQFPKRLELLTRQAFRDALTGLPNRALFMDRLSHGLTRARRRHEHVAVLFLDLDRFKVINDTLGHTVGDQLLVEVSNRLGTSLRPGDTVARLGGDEFGLLLEDVADAETAEAVALRIEAELAKPLSFEGREVFVTASIGIALSSERLGTPEEVLRDADLAMYHAKSKGKARHEIFDGTMSAPALDRMDLEMDLRSAISRNEFRLHYQPILRLDTGQITGVEALIRWQHEKRGLLQPDAFIGLTEETGLIIPIGRWVLSEACRQAREWQLEFPRNPQLVMSVNLSAKQFQNPRLVEEITDVGGVPSLSPANPPPVARAGQPQARDHRERRDAGRAGHPGQAPRAQGAWHQARHRRLRHGLFVARLPQALSGGHAQDRPLLREGADSRGRRQRDRAGGGDGRQEPQHGRDRGRHRDGSAADRAEGAGLRSGTGLSVRAARDS